MVTTGVLRCVVGTIGITEEVVVKVGDNILIGLVAVDPVPVPVRPGVKGFTKMGLEWGPDKGHKLWNRGVGTKPAARRPSWAAGRASLASTVSKE